MPPAVVMICGDSVATPFGLSPRESLGFVQILRNSLRGKARVISIARSGAVVTDTLAQVAKLIESDPSVVVLMHGGGESILKISPLLRIIRTDLHGRIDRNLFGLVTVLRRRAYRAFLSAIQTPAGEVLALLMGCWPKMHHRRFSENLRALVDAIIENTNASIVAVVPYAPGMSVFPYSNKNHDNISRVIQNLRDRGGRLTILDPRNSSLREASNYLPDHVHFSEAGHAQMALELIRTIEALALPARAADGSRAINA
jgi:lysophospholipase L1-like esterase